MLIINEKLSNKCRLVENTATNNVYDDHSHHKVGYATYTGRYC